MAKPYTTTCMEDVDSGDGVAKEGYQIINGTPLAIKTPPRKAPPKRNGRRTCQIGDFNHLRLRLHL